MAVSSRKSIYAALIGNTLIAISKFAAAIVTGSSAMLSEGIHSLVDTFNQVLLLYGLKRASKPADEEFPFGYGKEVYFWSFVVAILIFAVGAGVSLYEGVIHIMHPSPVTNPTVNYIVLGLAALFEGGAWFFALREFSRAKGKWGYLEAVKKGKDPSLFVVLFEDSAALLGIAVAFIGIWLGQVTGQAYYDGIASVIIGCILGGTAVWLAYETKGLLIGESANSDIIQNVRAIVQDNDEIENINEILTMHMGPDYILVNISVDFKNDISADQVERRVARIDQDLKLRFPQIKRVFIEAESRRIEGRS